MCVICSLEVGYFLVLRLLGLWGCFSCGETGRTAATHPEAWGTGKPHLKMQRKVDIHAPQTRLTSTVDKLSKMTEDKRTRDWVAKAWQKAAAMGFQICHCPEKAKQGEGKAWEGWVWGGRSRGCS